MEELPIAQRRGYVYRPLQHSDSFRLLKLLPAKDYSADLCCRMVHSRLEEFTEYEAISYVWGSPTLNGLLFTSEGSIKITTSLRSALRRFRLPDQERVLWADAVCINQVGTEDKARQLPLMGKIYQNASRVLAWLGEGTEESVKAVNECKNLAGLAEKYHVEPVEFDFNVFLGPQLKVPRAREGPKGQAKTQSLENINPDQTLIQKGKILEEESGDIVDPATDTVNEADKMKVLTHYNLSGSEIKELQNALKLIVASGLESIVTLPWFSRLWVIQEVANSKTTTLHWDEVELQWNVLESVLRVLIAILNIGRGSKYLDLDYDGALKTIGISRAWNIIQIRNEFRVMSREDTYALSLYRQFGRHFLKTRLHLCYDDRDRIYALMSLSPPHRGINIQPDYDKTASEVFTDVAKQYLNSGIHVDVNILYDSGLWCRSYDDAGLLVSTKDVLSANYLPSWVPEYRPSMLNQEELPWEIQPFDACHVDMYPKVYEYPNSKNIIGLASKKIDRVESLVIAFDQEMLAKYQAGTITQRGIASLGPTSGVTGVRNVISGVLPLLERLMPDRIYPLTKEDIRVALLRTLLGDLSSKEVRRYIFNPPDVKDEKEVLACWDKYERLFVEADGELRLLIEQTTGPTPPLSDEATDTSELILAVLHVLQRCKFAVTTTGLLTLVPKMAEQQDSIVRISGTKVPFVIRNGSENEPSLIIGPCYVHGIMYSKVLSEASGREIICFA